MSITHLSLFKRSNGFWYVIYNDGGCQRWKSTGVTLKSDALKKLTEFDELLRTKSVSKTLKQFTTEFIPYAKATYAKPTVDIFTIGLRHLLSISGDCLLTQLTPQHIDKYKSERLKAVTATTVNVEIRGLRAVMNVALRWKMIESNPFSGVQLLKIAERASTFFSKEDFQKLVSIISEGWLKEMVLLSALTGMRRGETINLRWQDVDLDRKLIHIQSNATFKTKKGKRRTIPISDVAYVFSLNEKRVNESYVSHKFKDYVRIAKLNEKLHWHSIRHTFASWLVQVGVSLYEVQRLLGHSDIAITDVYSHLQSVTVVETEGGRRGSPWGREESIGLTDKLPILCSTLKPSEKEVVFVFLMFRGDSVGFSVYSTNLLSRFAKRGIAVTMKWEISSVVNPRRCLKPTGWARAAEHTIAGRRRREPQLLQQRD